MLVSGYTEQCTQRGFGTPHPCLHPSLAGSRGKEERRRAEGGEREGLEDSSINAK